ncbi:MAG: 4'-phosphopantetheinyl transferase superfamily protein [Clostridia bacterium]|nr:4'-phosphopantetheinyl transferase superfamily protein [Clostridia bacterium]
MQIKVYTADVSKLEDIELFMHLYSRVSEERRVKTDRMVFGKDKRLSLGAGALLEAALAAEGVSDFTMTTEHNKKPRLAHNDEIKFNISHSGTKVMCAISDHNIGCDVEQIISIDMEIAKRFFFVEEYDALMRCRDSESRNDLFFRYWTLKESFMKATGLGFELALDGFSIILDGADIFVRQNVDGRSFYFHEYLLNDGYKYAVCSEEKPEFPTDIIRYDYVRG